MSDYANKVLDAALGYEAKRIRKSYSEFLAQLQQERDEARAEVEKLKAVVKMTEHERDAAFSGHAASREFARGAALMRALMVDAIWDEKRGSMTRRRLSKLAEELPLPEYKP
jgi:hypothetical protein